MESTSVVVRQHKSNVVFTYLYGLFRISDISLGNVSVGIIGSIQRFASAIPKPIIKNPNAVIVYINLLRILPKRIIPANIRLALFVASVHFFITIMTIILIIVARIRNAIILSFKLNLL